jgi:hypothetical protein
MKEAPILSHEKGTYDIICPLIPGEGKHGKLLVITEVGCDAEALKRAMALCNTHAKDKRVTYFRAND